MLDVDFRTTRGAGGFKYSKDEIAAVLDARFVGRGGSGSGAVATSHPQTPFLAQLTPQGGTPSRSFSWTS